MTLIELKDFISKGIIPTDFMIFVSKDSKFLAKQYIQAIAKISTSGVNNVTSVYEPKQSSISLLTNHEGTINVLTTDTFDERAEDYTQFENTIVVCEQVDKSILKNVEKYIIKFPKLEEWQIFDYAKTLCSSIADDDLLWLVKASNNSIERVLNELDKVRVFNNEDQKAVFNAIRFDKQSDLYNIDLFTVINALVEGDSRELFEFLSYNDYSSLDPVMLANRVLTSLKNILLISQNPTLTAEYFGISKAQYKFIKYSYRSLDVNAAKEKIKFLTQFDLRLKTSKLELSKRDMFNYLINNLNYKITL